MMGRHLKQNHSHMYRIISKLLVFIAKLIGKQFSTDLLKSTYQNNTNNMREIDEIIIHCSATRPDQNISAADINHWHIIQGWEGIGYHFFIKLDGTIEPGRPINQVGAHCKGHNSNSIGICYAGGTVRYNDQAYNTDTRTPEQIRSMYLLIVTLLHCFPTIKKISGHNQYAKVDCPCFKVVDEYGNLIKTLKEHSLFRTKP